MSWVNTPGGVAHQDRRLQPADHLDEMVDDGGHRQILDRGRVSIQGLDVDLETWVARGEYAVTLLLVAGPSSAPSCVGSRFQPSAAVCKITRRTWRGGRPASYGRG
jgi:hypothetical protein